MRKIALVALALAVVSTPCLAASVDCAPDVRTRIESVRKKYVDGMGGVASSSFSSRPGSFSKMACLDRFMKGDMDIFFRPPDLNSLLEQVMTMACDKIEDTVGGAMDDGFDAISSFGDIGSGGLTLPSVGSSSFGDTLSLDGVFRR